MRIKIKKLNESAVIPKYAMPGDAGMDLVAVSRRYSSLKDYVEYDTGIAVEIPYGYVGLVFPRSSISNYDLNLVNGVGVVDSGYRNSIRLRFKWTRGGTSMYEVGDRIGQLIILPYPQVVWEVVDELGDTERGEGGFGSTSS